MDRTGALQAAWVGLAAGSAVVTAWLVDREGPAWLVGVAGIAAACAQVVLGVAAIRARRRERARLERVRTAAEGVLRGDLHHYAPTGGGDDIARLGQAVNALGDAVRSEHLESESERVLDKAMIRETPNGLVLVDGAGRIRSVNPALRRLVPVRDEAVGAFPSDVIPVPELQAVLDEAARTRGTAERACTVHNRDLLVRAHPVADGVGCMGIVLDVTSLRLAERARRDFVANVSHELRTPVTSLVGYAEALLEDRDRFPADAVPMLEAIDRNARRLHLLVTDVLQLSKIEARGSELPLTREDVRPIVGEVLDRHATVAAAKGVRLILDLPEALPALVNADALEHAFGNLVDNAIKYSFPGGAVRVRGATEGDRVRLEVADDGPGISPEHQPRIFERFYRGDPARSKQIPGTGLGLALVKHLSLAMRAEVKFESTVGVGSRFWLLLPT